MGTADRAQVATGPLGVLFFLSGVAALAYQVCWQRLLMTGLGSDAVSVAIIVSVFMAGLGIGALLGGQVADRARRGLAWFVGIELGIGLFGLCSVWVIEQSIAWAFPLGLWAALAGAALSLLLPTVLMGMTLPVLVILADRWLGSIGDATGRLYFVNTAGAAVGALVCGVIAFHFLDLRQVTWGAASLNLLVALGGWQLLRKGGVA